MGDKMKAVFAKNRNDRYKVAAGDTGSARVVHKNVWKRFFHTVNVARIPYISLFIYIGLSIAQSTFAVYIPQVNADFFNGDGGGKSVAMFFGCELLLTVIVQVVLYSNQIFRAKSNRNLRNVLWEKILKLKPSFYDRVSSNTLLSRITVDTESLNEFMIDVVWEMILGIYILALSLREMSKLSITASFVLLAFAPLAMLISFIMGRLNIKFENASKFKLANLTDYLSELVASLPVIKSFNRQDYESRRGESVVNEAYRAQRDLIGLDVLKQVVSTLFGILPEIVIIYIGVRLLNAGSIDAAGWYIFYVYSGTLLGFVTQLGGYWEQIKRIQGRLATVTHVLLEEEEGLENYVSEIIESGDISFDNVSFAYDENPVLDKITFTIPKNKTVAIVGYSGSGKSTVLKLLERVYEPTDGRILLGGKIFSDYDLTQWRNKIAVVSQNSPMISGTIRDNILYGIKRDVSDAEIMKAAKLAYVSDFIEKCPDGLNHDVGQFGTKLSGGQRQKISIARAILKEPEYLILDEPTASLDILSVNEIMETIRSLRGKMTIVVVAHQPKIVEDADNIVVINDDHAAIEGDHKVLMATNDFYRQLISSKPEVNTDEE